MKLRFWALGCGAGIALLLAAILPVLHFRNPTNMSPTPGPVSNRLPSAMIPPPPEPEYCRSLYKMICQKRGITRDPTGLVRPDVDGELMVLRMYEDIIREHPDWTSEQVDEELANEVYTPRTRARIESVFHWVQVTLCRIIDRQPDTIFTPAQKRLLKTRLRKVALQLPPPAAAYSDEPDLLTKNDVFYERLRDGSTRLRVGGAYFFTARSYFNMVFTMGHELAHSIDPCELKAAGIKSIPAYERVSSCFLRIGTVARRRKTRVECGADDQLSETFADWMGVQATAEALGTFATEFHGTQVLNAVTNAVRDLCEPDAAVGDELDLEYHPGPEVRIDKILGGNPRIREILGCAPLPANDVCGFDSILGRNL